MRTSSDWTINKVLAVLLVLTLVWGVFVGGRFVENRPRANTVRARSDMRWIAIALEKYRADHGAYPPPRRMVDAYFFEQDLQSKEGLTLSTLDTGGEERVGLTTPVAYMSSIPLDISAGGKAIPFAYWTDGKHYLLIATGPDGHFNIANPDTALIEDGAALRLADPDWEYDPTNGSISEGDLVRIGSPQNTDAATSQSAPLH